MKAVYVAIASYMNVEVWHFFKIAYLDTEFVAFVSCLNADVGNFVVNCLEAEFVTFALHSA